MCLCEQRDDANLQCPPRFPPSSPSLGRSPHRRCRPLPRSRSHFMTKSAAGKRRAPSPARIELLRVENYRALRNVELSDITPLTTLLGPNGSGKSTVFDVFNFLSECFQSRLRHAWDRRGHDTERTNARASER